MVNPVEKPVEPEPEQHGEAPNKPPGYASIAAGSKDGSPGVGVPAGVNKNDNIKDEMPTIDDWNEDIAKEEESDSREYKGGRGRGGGRGRRGGHDSYRGRGG